MVEKYYVAIRPQTNEQHAVHKEGCPFLPDDEKRIYLGVFNSGKDAVREGQRHFDRTNSCLFCSKEHQPEIKKKEFAREFEAGYIEIKAPRFVVWQSMANKSSQVFLKN